MWKVKKKKKLVYLPVAFIYSLYPFTRLLLRGYIYTVNYKHSGTLVAVGHQSEYVIRDCWGLTPKKHLTDDRASIPVLIITNTAVYVSNYYLSGLCNPVRYKLSPLVFFSCHLFFWTHTYTWFKNENVSRFEVKSVSPILSPSCEIFCQDVCPSREFFCACSLT